MRPRPTACVSFQHAGWKETQVVGRFYLVAITLAIVALVSLKLR